MGRRSLSRSLSNYTFKITISFKITIFLLIMIFVKFGAILWNSYFVNNRFKFEF